MIHLFLHPSSLFYIFLAFVLYFTVSYWTTRFKNYRKIDKLGGRAPSIKSWAPFGLDYPYYTVQASKVHRYFQFWQWMFEHNGGAARNSYTSELLIAGNVRVIFTADPENVKAILTSQFAEYGKGERFHGDWEEWLGDSIFTTDGQQWHDQRQLIRPMFIRERVDDLYLFEHHAQKLISLLGPGDGREIRLDRLFSRFTLDVSTDFLLGESVGSLDHEMSEFATAFEEVQMRMMMKARAGPLKFLLNTTKLQAGIRTIEAFIEPFIDQTLALSTAELEQKLSKSETFIHALARFTRDRKVIRDQLMSVLLAGRDTTSSTLSWVFLELARNPQVVAKLRAEIIGHLGPYGQLPTYHNVKDMKFLTYVINETLRLYPVLPYNVRHSLVDTTLPRGGGPDGLSPVGVLAGTPVSYSTLVLHRRRDLYPPISESFPYDPLEWVPDRWATWTPKPWNYIPFNGGPRICIGQQFAMVQMGFTICRILQYFESITDFGNKVVLKSDIVLLPGEGVKVGFNKGQLLRP